jgi:hypothetical protein
MIEVRGLKFLELNADQQRGLVKEAETIKLVSYTTTTTTTTKHYWWWW